MLKTIQHKKKSILYPLFSYRERLLLWEKMRGMWKDRKPDPVKELAKMRHEENRKLPSFK